MIILYWKVSKGEFTTLFTIGIFLGISILSDLFYNVSHFLLSPERNSQSSINLILQILLNCYNSVFYSLRLLNFILSCVLDIIWHAWQMVINDRCFHVVFPTYSLDPGTWERLNYPHTYIVYFCPIEFFPTCEGPWVPLISCLWNDGNSTGRKAAMIYFEIKTLKVTCLWMLSLHSPWTTYFSFSKSYSVICKWEQYGAPVHFPYH